MSHCKNHFRLAWLLLPNKIRSKTIRARFLHKQSWKHCPGIRLLWLLLCHAMYAYIQQIRFQITSVWFTKATYLFKWWGSNHHQWTSPLSNPESKRNGSSVLRIFFSKILRKIQESKTKHKEVIKARIDPQVYAKNLAKIALRKEINALKFNEIFNPEQREKIELNMKATSLII